MFREIHMVHITERFSSLSINPHTSFILHCTYPIFILSGFFKSLWFNLRNTCQIYTSISKSRASTYTICMSLMPWFFGWSSSIHVSFARLRSTCSDLEFFSSISWFKEASPSIEWFTKSSILYMPCYWWSSRWKSLHEVLSQVCCKLPLVFNIKLLQLRSLKQPILGFLPCQNS